MEVLQQLLESFNCTVPQDELQVVVIQILLPHLTNHSFELDNHEHFALVAWPAAEVEAPALELEDAVCFGLEEFTVIEQCRELVSPVLRLGVLHDA